MKRDEYRQLLNSEKYQVFIFHCPVTFPLSFASHPWFVCNEKGKITRWEVLDRLNENEEWAYLHKDYFPMFRGIEVIPFIRREPFWKGRILKRVEGDLAKRMIDVITSSHENYPIREYSLIGTNSNTYAQWVLDQFEDLGFKLPWNSFGRNAAKHQSREFVLRWRTGSGSEGT
ncbi:MAG: DUF3750 domain-containing protein [Candidatus Moranbacteria bacterium]|nr:DUF3750 domain-containing protein [Candidatus Moranbacteria bacterium]